MAIALTMILFSMDFLKTFSFKTCDNFYHILTLMFLLSFLHFLLYAELFNKMIDLRNKKKKKRKRMKVRDSFGENNFTF